MKSLLRYELDDFGKIGTTLKEFDSLKEMDEYLKKFNDSNDVKEEYINEINEFLKTKKAIDFLANVPNENNGYLRGYTPSKNKLRHITLIFNNNLLPEEKCYTKLREKLEENKVLYDLYHRKYYLLPSKPTLFLKDELRHAVVHHGTKRIFIKEFIIYIRKLDPEGRYFVLRTLSDKCKLLENNKGKTINNYKIRKDNLSSLSNGYKLVKVRHFPFGDYSLEELHEMEPKDEKIELRDDVSEYDEFSNKNITDLLKEFDIDELDKKITYFDEMERGRKK